MLSHLPYQIIILKPQLNKQTNPRVLSLTSNKRILVCIFLKIKNQKERFKVARAALTQMPFVFINIKPHGSHLVLNNRRKEPLKITQALATRKWQVKKAVKFSYLKLEGGGLQDIMKTIKRIRRGVIADTRTSPQTAIS